MSHNEGRAIAYLLEMRMENAYAEVESEYTSVPSPETAYATLILHFFARAHIFACCSIINQYIFLPEDSKKTPVHDEYDIDDGESDDDDFVMENA